MATVPTVVTLLTTGAGATGGSSSGPRTGFCCTRSASSFADRTRGYQFPAPHCPPHRDFTGLILRRPRAHPCFVFCLSRWSPTARLCTGAESCATQQELNTRCQGDALRAPLTYSAIQFCALLFVGPPARAHPYELREVAGCLEAIQRAGHLPARALHAPRRGVGQRDRVVQSPAARADPSPDARPPPPRDRAGQHRRLHAAPVLLAARGAELAASWRAGRAADHRAAAGLRDFGRDVGTRRAPAA